MIRKISLAALSGCFLMLLLSVSAWSTRADAIRTNVNWYPNSYNRDAYKFPVKSGTDEWKALGSRDERVASLQIPQRKLTTMSTEGLVKTSLENPFFIDLILFNTFQQGMDAVIEDFNGIQELFNRKDAGATLVNLYASMDPEKTDTYTPFDFLNIEMLLAQEEILQTLTDKERAYLLQLCAEKATAKQKRTDVYSAVQYQTISLIAGRILVEESNEFREVANKNESVQTFLETGMLIHDEDLKSIFGQLEQASRDYIESNK